MGQAALNLEPQGEWLSQSQIAKHCKLDKATVCRRLDDLGYEPDEERSGPKLKVFWFDTEMEMALRSAKDTVSATRIRDMRAAAELKELKLARERGELVSIQEATEIVQRIVSTIYQELTVRQPKRIASKLAKAKNVTEVKKCLNPDNKRIMKSLRENFERFIG